jgi:hypothetical protein
MLSFWIIISLGQPLLLPKINSAYTVTHDILSKGEIIHPHNQIHLNLVVRLGAKYREAKPNQKYRTKENSFIFGSQFSGTKRSEVNPVVCHGGPKYWNRNELDKSSHLVPSKPSNNSGLQPPSRLTPTSPCAAPSPTWRRLASCRCFTPTSRFLACGTPCLGGCPTRPRPLSTATPVVLRLHTLYAPPRRWQMAARRPNLCTTRPCYLPRWRCCNAATNRLPGGCASLPWWLLLSSTSVLSVNTGTEPKEPIPNCPGIGFF